MAGTVTPGAYQIRCGNCQTTVLVSTDWVGKRVQCSACGAVLMVPPPPSAVPPAPAPPPAPKPTLNTTPRPGPAGTDRVSLSAADAPPPATPDDSHFAGVMPGEQVAGADLDDDRLADGVPVRPLVRMLSRLADLKAQFLALRGKPAESEQAAKANDQTSNAILDDIRETVKRVQVAVIKMHKAHGDKVFPVLVRLRETDPAASDRELREILLAAMKTFPEQFSAWEKAQALAEKKMKAVAEEQEARFKRALAAYQKGQYKESAVDLEPLVAQRPLNGQARKFLGLSLLKLKRFDEAVIHLAVAATVTSESAPLRYDLAVALMQADHANAAARQLQSALRIKPDFEPAKALLAKIEAGE